MKKLLIATLAILGASIFAGNDICDRYQKGSYQYCAHKLERCLSDARTADDACEDFCNNGCDSEDFDTDFDCPV